jgi:hypothetical protein
MRGRNGGGPSRLQSARIVAAVAEGGSLDRASEGNLDSKGDTAMSRHLRAYVVAALLASTAPPTLAHHSFAAEFDDKQPLTLSGTLVKVEWTNPHIWYYLDVKNPDGTVTTWGLSGGAPGQMMRRGVRKGALVIGSVVSVEGFKAKDGSNNGFGSKVTYQDGRNVFTATPLDRQSGPGR